MTVPPDSSSTARGVRRWIGVALATAIAGAVVAAASSPRGADGPPLGIATPPVEDPPPAPAARPAASPEPRARRPEPIRWRRSIAVGTHSAGRLVRGVRLPAERRSFLTWDPVLRRAPNRH